MPGAFPAPERASIFTMAKNLPTMPAKAQGAPVPANVFPSFANVCGKKGLSRIRINPNRETLGCPYRPPTENARVNPVGGPLTDDRVFDRVMGSLNMTLSGVSKDSSGVALGNCTVMIFRNEDRSFIMETTSDASGNWSVPLMKGGPFFLVEYKTGTPDVAGTSVNTLVPTKA